MNREREIAQPPVLLGIPTVDWMYTASAAAILFLSHNLPPGSEVHLLPESASSIAAKRTTLVERLLANPRLERLCFIDSDMVPPTDAVARLLAWDRDIISALYTMRQPPYPIAAQFLDDRAPTDAEAQQPVRVRAVGFGCVLVKRQVFETIGGDWFAERPGFAGQGEDGHFCDRAHAAGIPIYLDLQLEVGHLGVTPLTCAYARNWNAVHSRTDPSPAPRSTPQHFRG
jgi:hypothetical protein